MHFGIEFSILHLILHCIMPFIRLTKIEKRRVFSLLACLLLAIAAWAFYGIEQQVHLYSKNRLSL
jgi:hypothetical protein